jgi:hypothetical protein
VKLSNGEPVDIQENLQMANRSTQNADEPTLAQVLEAIQGIGERVEAIEGNQAALAEQIENGPQAGNEFDPESVDPNALAQFARMTPQQLAQYNRQNRLTGTDDEITREQIDATIDQWNGYVEEAGEGAENEGGEGEVDGEGEEGATAGAAAGGGGETSAAFGALNRRLVQLESEIKQQKRLEARAAEQHEFQAIEHNFEVIAEQRDQLLQFARDVTAENEALRLCVRTGTRPVKGGHVAGERFFSAGMEGDLHEFQERCQQLRDEKKAKSLGEAIQLASRENPALHRDWLRWQAEQRTTIHA